MRNFIVQQPTTLPEDRRRQDDRPIVKFKKRRGRRKDYTTVNRFFRYYWAFKQYMMTVSSHVRENFMIALFSDRRTLNTMNSAFVRLSQEEKAAGAKLQKRYHRRFCKLAKLISVPVFTSEEIIAGNFEIKEGRRNKQRSVTIQKNPLYGDDLICFAMNMPDNCMAHDGICRGDGVVVAANLRPSQGDMVACIIPGGSTVTVRRYGTTCNPGYFDLYEGGGVNPVFASDHEKLLYGVVIGVVRNYWPGRLPEQKPVPENSQRR